MSDRYNVVVIGAGAAGLISAYVVAALQGKVALIEKNKMGGDCLNYGCVPSKALIRTAKFIAEMQRHKELGVKTVHYELDFAEVMDRVHRVIGKIAPHDSVARYTKLGVECIEGHAEVIDPHTVKVGGRLFATRSIILALGGSPAIPPINGLNKIKFLTSENLWELKTLPKRLAVLGGGPIGAELTQAFTRLGSKVTQIEMGPRLLPKEDADVAEEIQNRFIREGVEVLTNTKAQEVIQRNGEKILICSDASGKKIEVPFDEILVAVGRKANTANVDWQRLGIELNKEGTFKVDRYLRTTQKNIYACGDAAGPYQFTHVASHQAGYCALNALLSPFKKFSADYRVVPWCTFTDPEVAQVGLNETSAQAQGIAYEVTKYGLDDLDRAICESEDHGFVKILTKPGKSQILGATIVSHNAGELLTEFATAMKFNLGITGIFNVIHSYPTFAEANKNAAGRWRAAHAPQWGLKILRKFHRWRR